MYTLVDVLAYLARRWSREKKRFEQRTQYTRTKCNNLDRQIAEETDPERKQVLQDESDKVSREWEEADDAFSSQWDYWFPNSVKWCARHTGVGSEVVHHIAVADFDASVLKAEKPELQTDLPKLVSALLQLPLDSWQTTGWAESVLPRQPKSDTGGQDSEPSGESNSTPTTKAAVDEATQPKAETSTTLRPCDQKAYSQYQHAIEQDPTLSTDDEVYDSVSEDANVDGLPLPRRDSWKRFLGRARAYHDQRKNGPRIGNETRSVVSAKRLDAPKQTKTDQR